MKRKSLFTLWMIPLAWGMLCSLPQAAQAAANQPSSEDVYFSVFNIGSFSFDGGDTKLAFGIDASAGWKANTQYSHNINGFFTFIPVESSVKVFNYGIGYVGVNEPKEYAESSVIFAPFFAVGLLFHTVQIDFMGESESKTHNGLKLGGGINVLARNKPLGLRLGVFDNVLFLEEESSKASHNIELSVGIVYLGRL